MSCLYGYTPTYPPYDHCKVKSRTLLHNNYIMISLLPNGNDYPGKYTWTNAFLSAYFSRNNRVIESVFLSKVELLVLRYLIYDEKTEPRSLINQCEVLWSWWPYEIMTEAYSVDVCRNKLSIFSSTEHAKEFVYWIIIRQIPWWGYLN